MENIRFSGTEDSGVLERAGAAAAQKARGEGELTAVSAAAVTARVSAAFTALRAAHADALGYAAKSHAMPRELEWLTDNWYMLERECRAAASSLKSITTASGSKSRAGETPAVLTICGAMLDTALREHIPLSAGLIAAFLRGAQRVRPLSEAELWSAVPVLKCAAILRAAGLSDDMNRVMAGAGGDPDDNPFAAEREARACREEGRAVPERTAALAARAEETHAQLAGALEFVFSTLRYLGSAELHDTLRSVSLLDAALRDDPAGVYPHMDERSQASYRAALSRLARRARISELDAAKRCLSLSERAGDERRRHVGYYILEEPLGKKPSGLPGALYFLLLFLLPLALAAAGGILLKSAVLGLILYLPLFELTKNLTDTVYLRVLRPTHIPRMELHGGIPPEGRALCVISALLTRPERASELVRQLEQYRIASGDRGGALLFGILADLKDGPDEETPGDAAVLEAARAEVESLNRQYGPFFYLLARRRTKNTADNLYMGWERKRGAIVELVRLLCGERSPNGGVRVLAGDERALSGIPYVVTLDADTRPAIACLRELVAAMLHPLNRPVLDERRGVVTAGHALLQPRVSVELDAAAKSPFTRIFAGQGGCDPYNNASADLYQDLFGEGSFTGKGIFDVRVFHRLLDARFPENAVLSHDLLEGCHLRAGFIGDLELMDGYPYKVSAYYDRQHRWVRGDWQLLRWLSPRVPTSGGRTEQNPLNGLSIWKLADNLRRSLTPAACAAALLYAALEPRLPGGPRGAALTAALVALLALASGLLISAAASVFRPGGRERYHSTIIAGFPGAFLQTLFNFMLLPYAAYVDLSAAVTALWRTFVSHRRMLRWITAAEAEGAAKGGMVYYYRRMWIVLPAAAVCLLGGSWAAYTLAVLWVLAPAAASALSRPAPPRAPIPGEERGVLRGQAANMYRYFTDFMNAENHFLPPDNYQVQPATGLARRTSPTNIGLAMLCTLGAVDLGLETPDGALSRLSGTMDTLEKLEKWHGHLLNWYDTSDLHPLTPRWVSTVDSGNLLGCLIALRQGLLALPEPYADRARALSDRMRALGDAMRFEPLYDQSRKLFHIGWDLETGRPTEGWYDLMASEARLSSYIAVARGEVEPRHWGRLGRTLVAMDGYRGMASWTGTMFEYLMPNLLLPCYENSMMYESVQFALYCQQQRHRPRGIPYGISESAFYAFDADMNYQYKANGVQRLGFKRGLNRDTVISPYAAYLALTADPIGGFANLRLYDGMDMSGPYGLYEAADLTPSRIPKERAYMPVRCYMAHHLGMSFLAVVNVLTDGVMCRRFMADVTMRAFSGLLKERVPVNAVVVEQPAADIPEKPHRASCAAGDGLRLESGGYDLWMPRSTILSNGSYRLFMTDTGLSYSQSGAVDLTVFSPRQLEPGRLPAGAGGGIRFLARADGRLYSLTPAPFYDADVQYGSRFDGSCAVLSMRAGDLKSAVTAMVSACDTAEVRRVTLENTSDAEKTVELFCYAEPCLMPRRDYGAHPAFAKLFLELWAEGGAVHIRRRSREGGPDCFAALAADPPPQSVELDREKALGRGGLGALRRSRPAPPPRSAPLPDPAEFARMIAPEQVRRRLRADPSGSDAAPHRKSAAASAPPPGTTEATATNTTSPPGKTEENAASAAFSQANSTEFAVDPCVLMRFSVTLPPRGSRTFSFAQAIGKSERGASEAARRTLGIDRIGASRRLSETMALLKLSQTDVANAFDMLTDCTFLTPNHRRGIGFLQANRLGRETLWKYGVSGDLPIIAVGARTAEAQERLVKLLRRHLFLFLNGGYTDLVLLLDDGGNYRRPVYSSVMEALRLWDSENMIGIKGGYHIIDVSSIPKAELAQLGAAASLYIDLDQAPYQSYQRRRRELRPAAAPAAGPIAAQAPPVEWADGTASFDCSRGLPPVAWSHALANRSFGCLATDCGGGFIWYQNSRENKINEWHNDPLAVEGPEQVRIACGPGQPEFSLFAAPDGLPCRVTYGPGFARWEKSAPGLEVRTTMFVPPHHAARLLWVEARGALAEKAELSYHTLLLLGENETQAAQVVTAADGAPDGPEPAMLTASNAAGSRFYPYLFVTASLPARAAFTCDEAAYRAGDYNGTCGAGFPPCHAMRVPLERGGDGVRRAVIVSGAAPDGRGAARLAALGARVRELYEETCAYFRGLTCGLTVRTPNPAIDRYLNGFALTQVIACRLFARTSLYQNGGAYGFRDQLQDALALLSAPPDRELAGIARTQLLRSAARQFPEGDVQHWWHPVKNRAAGFSHPGVRTRISDDLLFLPLAAARYVRATGDAALLSQPVPYIESPPLPPDCRERYETPRVSALREPLYDHCLRAIDCVIRRGTGAHGLPLIGGGDWNDGFNLVGADGRGESVWLAWFAARVFREFAQICRLRGDPGRADELLRAADAYADAAGKSWDGEWFRRGYYDDGTPLGSAGNAACRIDAVAQAFSPAGDPVRAREALLSAFSRLADPENRLVRLFTPPFGLPGPEKGRKNPNPGYIRAYPPGVRENGGQYTHGAVFLALGLYEAGLYEEGYRVLDLLLPSARDPARYKTEPFYLCADVYDNENARGRGGWSLYTGAAGWYYTAAVRCLLGLRFEAGRMRVEPHLPRDFPGAECDVRIPGALYRVRIRRTGAPGVTLDGAPCTDGVALAPGSGEHEVAVTV